MIREDDVKNLLPGITKLKAIEWKNGKPIHQQAIRGVAESLIRDVLNA